MTRIASRHHDSPYLDPHVLASVGSLELRARMIVEGIMTGMHRSPLQGVSIEFAQHRQYAPGDDIRHLDWKVYGRSDKLYVKQYHRETNLDLLVLVDTSGSMSYRSDQVVGKDGQPWRKYDHAASLAAAMTYMAVQQQDRTGLVQFTGSVVRTTRLSNTREHWRSLMGMLQNASPDPLDETSVEAGKQHPDRTDFRRVAEQTIARLTNRSLIVLISDLFDDVDHFERMAAQFYHRRHDLIVMQTLDPAELTFPFRSASDFIGLEGEGRLALDPNALRKAYLEALNQHTERVEDVTRRFHFDYLRVNTGETLLAPLSQFLARRAAQINRGSK
jgi:uncharacterized protein (DUF58 family)